MNPWVIVGIAGVVLFLLGMSIRIVKQFEKGVQFRLGRVIGVREPGLRFVIPVIDLLRGISLRIVTMPIQSQGIITRDNVSVDVSAVAYFRLVDAVKSVVAIENVYAAIDQIAQTNVAEGHRGAHARRNAGRDGCGELRHPPDPRHHHD
ncbi:MULTISPECIES: SPFH domain-containing protein [unclassified Amycolatopsis]|uniref:SPFH domain-containing protein n=1 Tax=unclassified Amycolatopsis TaxID=2618356 RepID=UPI0021072169|nr:SPFH domain-containing protein [Amycolatopsis sp. DSM 110486]